MSIIKQLNIILTEDEINSSEEIIMKVNVYSEIDPDNKDGVTYTITYPKD